MFKRKYRIVKEVYESKFEDLYSTDVVYKIQIKILGFWIYRDLISVYPNFFSSLEEAKKLMLSLSKHKIGTEVII